MTVELTIWEHPTNGQPFKRQTLMAVKDVERTRELILRAEALGFVYCTQLGGRYLFTHPDHRDTAQIAVAE